MRASGTILLDELTGPNFVILTRAQLPADCPHPALAAEWRRRGGRIVVIGSDDSPAAGESDTMWLKEQGHLFADWMASLGAAAVVVRPDRHVYGVAAAPADLNRLLRELFAGLDAKA